MVTIVPKKVVAGANFPFIESSPAQGCRINFKCIHPRRSDVFQGPSLPPSHNGTRKSLSLVH